jgi:hypothetical protein
MHLFERRAREAGQRDTRPADDARAEFVTIDRARQFRLEAEAERQPAPASAVVSLPPRELTQEELTWSVRGEPRTRDTFGLPAPGDFPGGLPLPAECP